MLSTKQIFEISDLNKSRLGVAGRAALVGGAGFAAYHALKGNDVEKPEHDGSSEVVKSNTMLDKALANSKNLK